MCDITITYKKWVTPNYFKNEKGNRLMKLELDSDVGHTNISTIGMDKGDIISALETILCTVQSAMDKEEKGANK